MHTPTLLSEGTPLTTAILTHGSPLQRVKDNPSRRFLYLHLLLLHQVSLDVVCTRMQTPYIAMRVGLSHYLTKSWKIVHLARAYIRSHEVLKNFLLCYSSPKLGVIRNFYSFEKSYFRIELLYILFCFDLDFTIARHITYPDTKILQEC